MSQAVLLVEDNHDNRMIYGIMLEHAGYTVIQAVDGEEGLERARELRPALILMDVSLPKMDGYSATRILKADGWDPHRCTDRTCARRRGTESTGCGMRRVPFEAR